MTNKDKIYSASETELVYLLLNAEYGGIVPKLYSCNFNIAGCYRCPEGYPCYRNWLNSELPKPPEDEGEEVPT